MNFLVVDDHPIVQQGITALLSEAFPEAAVLTAADLAEAAAVIERTPRLSAILLDLVLPGVSGASGVRALVDCAPAVPVLVLSSSENPVDVRAALSLGARGYVPKTSGSQTLVSALRLVLAGETYVPPLLFDAAMPAAELTGRQSEVLVLLGDGFSNKDIARRLALSEKTVKAHVGAIFRALGVVSRTQAVKAARAAGLL